MVSVARRISDVILLVPRQTTLNSELYFQTDCIILFYYLNHNWGNIPTFRKEVCAKVNATIAAAIWTPHANTTLCSKNHDATLFAFRLASLSLLLLDEDISSHVNNDYSPSQKSFAGYIFILLQAICIPEALWRY